MTFAEIFQTLVVPYGAMAVVILTFITNKSRERSAEIRREKLEHYKEFVRTLGEYTSGGSTPAERNAFTKACNRIHLVASGKVLQKLHPLLAGLKNEDTEEVLQVKLDALINCMRKDLGFTKPFENPVPFILST